MEDAHDMQLDLDGKKMAFFGVYDGIPSPPPPLAPLRLRSFSRRPSSSSSPPPHPALPFAAADEGCAVAIVDGGGSRVDACRQGLEEGRV